MPALTNGENAWLTVVGAGQNNLRSIDVDIPLGRFVCVTGVSGSGKSSLVNDIIRETLARDLNGAVKVNPGKHQTIEGIEHLDKVIDIDQSPIGRTPRSNPATYVKVFDLIRNLYAKLPDSKVRGYKPGRFSFNVHTGKAGGGRCEACEGNGANKMEMDFLADVWVTCPVCGGRRFSRETLQIHYKGKSIADVLDMDVQEALDHFENVPRIAAMLKTLHDVGLGYMKLGQSSTTLSGGEAQRIKLARELVKKSTGTTLYILDEPTTGLHFDDIKKLLAVLHGFVDAGNSVIVIEHNLDVIKTADWVIDLGPEGGEGGGRIVAAGTPERVARSKRSYTGAVLRDVLIGPVKGASSPGAPPLPGAGDRFGNCSIISGTNSEHSSKPPGKKDCITVVGARQHNLKDITVDVPRGRMTVCSGPSGSGKSSFAIDTVYTEGQRRYVESLSAYARQFIGQLEPPKVDHIEGLSPSICIERKSAGRSPRSTVGTVTEVYDYMRILWARIGQPYCPRCKIKIGTQSSDEIVEKVLALGEGKKVLLLAPIERTGQESYEQLFARELANGFARVRVDGTLYKLDDDIDIDSRRRHRMDLVIDRIVVKRSQTSRLTDSVEQALSIGNGVMEAQAVDDQSAAGGSRARKPRTGAPKKSAARRSGVRFSQHFSCDRCSKSFDELTPHHFSFNSRLGWCKSCEGLGTQKGATPSAIIVHPTLSVLDGAVSGWGKLIPGSKLALLAGALADHIGFPADKPFNSLTEAQKLAFLHGCGDDWIESGIAGLRFRWRGFYPAINRATRVSWQYRKNLDKLVTEVPCEACGGSRLRPESVAVRLKGVTIHEACTWSLGDALKWFKRLRLDAREKRVAGELVFEITSRLRFLVDVGLDYVTLSRTSSTLSGGEAQRIRLASQIGTGLTGVLYVLDEPTIGLHPRDNHRLIQALRNLRSLGNTLIVVEHDRDIIDSADRVLDFGPGAGRLGGRITAQASPKRLRSSRASLTGKYLAGKTAIAVPSNRRPIKTVGSRLIIHGAREHNLKEIDVELPLGRFICVTGVSGSGKSSLISRILYPAVASRIHRAGVVPGGHERISGIEHIDKVINADQSPIGTSPTSNPATYTGLFDEVRALFAKLPQSKVRGYTPNRFSFNRPGGRCEACEGMGQRCIEMHFLPDVWIECDNCKGTRYVPETLEVRYRGKNIAEVLDMTVSEALELFANVPKVRRMLRTLDDVGLGYLPLGQPAPTLSGGEAQRVKLAGELGRPSTGKTLYILDEPTTGLHFDDLKKLLAVLHRLVDLGNTCVCIEHNLDVIKTADYVVDLGPEAADDGGMIVAAGTPEEVASTEQSHTGRCLKGILEAGPAEQRAIFDPRSQARLDEPAETRIDLGDDVRMPWDRDGERWHTVDRLDRKGQRIQWDPKLLIWIVRTIEAINGFAPTDWNDRARVEIKAPGKGQWFSHFLTGGKDLLDVIMRVPKGTFTELGLVNQLMIPTLDERDDLPIYGPWDRALLRSRSTHWDEIRLWLRDHKDIDKRIFRSFVKKAAGAYLKRFEEERSDLTKREPWKTDGRKWHLSQTSITAGRRIRWSTATLVALIGRFKKLQPDLVVDWTSKVAVGLVVPGEMKPAGKIVTNLAQGMRIELLAQRGLCTPTQIEKLGLETEIKNRQEYDSLVFWVRTLEHNDARQLADVWRRCRENPVGGKKRETKLRRVRARNLSTAGENRQTV